MNMSASLLPNANRPENPLSSSIHKQPCYAVISSPRLESSAIYWSWKDASDVLNSSGTAPNKSSSTPSEPSTKGAAKASAAKRRRNLPVSDKGQKYIRFNNVFQAIEIMVGSTEYIRIIEAEAKRIRQKTNQQPTAARKQHIKFQDNMKLLRRFVEDNGRLPPMTSQAGRHPPGGVALQRFLIQMRQEVRKYQSHLSTSFLTVDHYDQLESIGFVEELRRQDTSSSQQEQKQPAVDQPANSTASCKSTVAQDQKVPSSSSSSSSPYWSDKASCWSVIKLQRWNEKLAKVQSFHKEHNRLPTRLDNDNLSRWIRQQKQRVVESMTTTTDEATGDSTATTNSGNESSASPSMKRPFPKLSAEQVVQLAAVGVSFTPPPPKISIETRCQQWISYRQQHGQNPSSNSALGKWATDTKAKYRSIKLGKKKTSNLTPELIDQLTNGGFVFPTDAEIEAFRKQQIEEQQKPKYTWDDHFGMLQKWKEEHGHLIIPRHDANLGNWAHSQRKEYNRLKRGESSCMNPERLKKLLSIGFSFSNVNWRKDRGFMEIDDDDEDGGNENHDEHSSLGLNRFE